MGMQNKTLSDLGGGGDGGLVALPLSKDFRILNKKTTFLIVEGLALCSIIYQILMIAMACL